MMATSVGIAAVSRTACCLTSCASSLTPYTPLPNSETAVLSIVMGWFCPGIELRAPTIQSGTSRASAKSALICSSWLSVGSSPCQSK